jgi:PhnB protein
MVTEPSVIPYLAYEDGVAAMRFLADAFGFEERTCMTDGDGRLMHGELAAGDGVIMLASPTEDYEGPARHRERCAAAARWSQSPWLINGVVVYVDDVDAHCQRARARGARILSEPQDGPPARRYRAEDCEGQRWMFMQR